jgi:hypothetical protein
VGGGGTGGTGGQIPAGPSAPAAFVAAASLYSSITGKSAAGTSYAPPGLMASQEPAWVSAAAAAVTAHATQSHYQAPFASAVRLETAPAGADFAFLDAGTSSEAIWESRMNEILPAIGLVPSAKALGGCNAMKTFDDACLTSSTSALLATQYRILFARDYSVSASAIAAAGQQTALTAQIWDRHYDGLSSDGLDAVEVLEERSLFGISRAHLLGLAWVPHHIAFARLKTARPAIQLTSDGTHATYPVGYALAAMSVFSRTSRAIPTKGLDQDTVAAVGFATDTIRQLSAMSRWGTFVPDDPATRPQVSP